jgi:tripartite ATP-independent transporter DctM subunit
VTVELVREVQAPASTHTRRTDVGRRLDSVLVGVAATALALELVVLFANMVARALFGSPFTWATEVGELALSVITFVGAAAAYRRGHHMSVDVVVDRMPARMAEYARALAEWAVLAICALLAALAFGSLDAAGTRSTVVLGISGVWSMLALAVALASIALFAVERLLTHPRRAVLVSGALLAVVVMAATWVQAGYVLDSDSAILVAAVALVLLLATGVPIAFVFGAATLTYVYLAQSIPPQSVPMNALNASQGVLLLAVPIFLLAGDIMTAGGLTRPLAEFVSMLVARLRGGLAQVAVATMYIFGGVSGSQLGDVAAIGRAMEHMFDREDYPREERAAVLAAGAAMGQTIPPSIGLLVLASAASLSVGALFLAGIVPALVIAICLMAMIFFRSARTERTERHRPSEILRAAAKSAPAGLVPVIIVGGIVTGIGTPTEASTLAVVYGLLVALVLYRVARPRDVLRLVGDAAVLSGMLIFIICTAATFSEAMTLAQIPQRIGEAIGSIAPTAWLFMLITIPVLVILGSILEGLPALLVLTPILMPVAVGYGVDELQFGIVLLIALAIGAFAPPIGIGMYTACAVTGTTMDKVMRPMVPYLITLVLGLLLVAFVPAFSLLLPDALGFGD